LTCLHGDLAFEQNIEVIVDNFVMRKNLVSIIEFLLFFIDIALQDLVDLVHVSLEPKFGVQLGQVIAYLGAVPAFRLAYLVYDFVPLGNQILQFSLAFLSTTVGINGQVSDSLVVLLGDKFYLLFSQLIFTDEMHLIRFQSLDVLAVGICDHAVADFKALVGQHFSFGARDLNNICMKIVTC